MSNKPLAVVTGSSNGIGYELAKILAHNGYDIVSVARSKDKLNEVEQEFIDLGAQVYTLPTDLSTYEGVQHLKKQIDEIGRPIHTLIINAGQGLGGKFIGGTELADELNLIRLNVDSYVHMAKRFLPDMVERGSGRVLMTSSISGTSPIPYETIYGANKAFINSFFWALRNEIKDSGVQLTLLLPGPTETNFFHNAGQANNTQVGESEKTSPATVARRAWYALESNHECVYGDEQAEYLGEVLHRNLSESQKAQARRIHSEPKSNTIDGYL